MTIYDNQAGTAPASEVKEETAVKEAETTAPAEEKSAEELLKLHLSDPFNYEGKTYTDLDLTGLYDMTGKDYMICERYCRKTGGFEDNMDPMKEFSMSFVIACASRATGKPMEFFEKMSIRNLVLVKNAVVGFIYGEG